MMMLARRVCIGFFFPFLVRVLLRWKREEGKRGKGRGKGDMALYDVIVRYPLADSSRVCELIIIIIMRLLLLSFTSPPASLEFGLASKSREKIRLGMNSDLEDDYDFCYKLIHEP